MIKNFTVLILIWTSIMYGQHNDLLFGEITIDNHTNKCVYIGLRSTLKAHPNSKQQLPYTLSKSFFMNPHESTIVSTEISYLNQGKKTSVWANPIFIVVRLCNRDPATTALKFIKESGMILNQTGTFEIHENNPQIFVPKESVPNK